MSPGLPLAESQCQADRCGRHGTSAEDQRVLHRWQPQEEVHGWPHIRQYLIIHIIHELNIHIQALALVTVPGFN